METRESDRSAVGGTGGPSRPEHPGDRSARTPVRTAVLAGGLLLTALNLRPGVASIGPVLSSIRDDLGLPASVASLLTTIPIVAFGAFAFLTPALTRRFGMHRLLGLTMLALAAGIALRLQPSLAGLFTGTVLVGAAIAVANVVMPAAVKRDFARQSGLMMGLYSTALFVGAALASGLTAPLASAVGGSWRAALAVWAIPAVVAFGAVLPQMVRAPRRDPRTREVADVPSERGEPTFRALFKDPVAIAVTTLMGTQSLAYYACLTWLPTLLQDHGTDQHTAGWLIAYSAFPGIVAALLVPGMARRMRPTWLPVLLSVLLTGAAYLGLGTAPVAGAYVWMTLLGLGQGAAISLSLTYIVLRSPDARHTGHVSTMAQGVGYLFAGLGPVGIGLVHTLTGGWGVPLLVLGALLLLQLAGGIAASRDRHVLTSR
ncbi:CynX/NimT family MFS transporter [Actinacidiphila sp. bgisy145]|uniref:CynX/NimT family MFS transporter n=1 Tax=Actinacidiphila sp. bgisy145 TaxID=3413792 RepID=UPI003EB932B8